MNANESTDSVSWFLLQAHTSCWHTREEDEEEVVVEEETAHWGNLLDRERNSK